MSSCPCRDFTPGAFYSQQIKPTHNMQLMQISQLSNALSNRYIQKFSYFYS